MLLCCLSSPKSLLPFCIHVLAVCNVHVTFTCFPHDSTLLRATVTFRSEFDSLVAAAGRETTVCGSDDRFSLKEDFNLFMVKVS